VAPLTVTVIGTRTAATEPGQPDTVNFTATIRGGAAAPYTLQWTVTGGGSLSGHSGTAETSGGSTQSISFPCSTVHIGEIGPTYTVTKVIVNEATVVTDLGPAASVSCT
jgi:hypothetical protein